MEGKERDKDQPKGMVMVGRRIAQNVENWPDGAKPFAEILKSCDHAAVAKSRNELQYDLSVEIREPGFFGLPKGEVERFGSLEIPFLGIPKSILPLRSAIAGEKVIRHMEPLHFAQLHAVKGLVKELASAIARLRNNKFLKDMEEASMGL